MTLKKATFLSLLNFEFFEHNGEMVTVEVTRSERPDGAVFEAVLSGDQTVRFEAADAETAVEMLKKHVSGGSKSGVSGGTQNPRGKSRRPVANMGRPLLILCVDDNPANLSLAMSVCEASGYQAVGAREGNEALAWLNSRPIDLVLTDLHMPGLGGLAFVQMLRASPSGKDLPIIAVTAAGPNGIKALWEVGVDEVVRKPYEIQELIAAIQAALVPTG
jgi:CheY-like chemotaxis protein